MMKNLTLEHIALPATVPITARKKKRVSALKQ